VGEFTPQKWVKIKEGEDNPVFFKEFDGINFGAKRRNFPSASFKALLPLRSQSS